MRTMLFTLLVLLAVPALAHPGEHHANLLATLWHLLSESGHLALINLALIAGVGGAVLSVLNSRRTP